MQHLIAKDQIAARVSSLDVLGTRNAAGGRLSAFAAANRPAGVIGAAITLMLLFFSFFSAAAKAEFQLNFTPKHEFVQNGNPGYFSTTHMNSDNGSNHDPSLNQNQTRYLMISNFERPEIVVDPITGKNYYHMIVGDMAEGFIQEVFIEMGFGRYNSDAETWGQTASASGGTGFYSWADGNKNNPDSHFGNGYDPLDMDADHFARKEESGNGSANPKRVIMRQIVSDGEIFMEFLKDRYEYKPRLSQAIRSQNMINLFDVDMRNISYNDETSSAPMSIQMSLWGDDVFIDGGAWNMATGSQHANVTAGQFVYNDGTGFGESEGTYSYASETYDHTSVDWQSYIDPYERNPWSFADSKVLPPH